MHFKQLSDLVEKNFATFGNFFSVELDHNELWDIYLDTFPEGTDEMFRVRSTHDCSCCRHFIRNVGGLVDVLDDYSDVKTIWDNADSLEYPYNIVAGKLAEHVRSKTIQSAFFTNQCSYGQKTSVARIEGIDHVVKFDHFFAQMPSAIVRPDFPTHIGSSNTKADVLKRTLENMKLSAGEEVLDLIKSNSIYRGSEFTTSVTEFCKLIREYQKLNSTRSRELFAWKHHNSMVAFFKNSAIGSLVEDLSNGVGIEEAVRMFESKVAPQNYKRSKALITPNMIKQALKTLDELGYRESMERRFANESDLSVNSVLFVDRATAPLMKDGLESLLMQETKGEAIKFDKDKVTRLHITEFLDNIVPKIGSMEVFMETALQNNLMSLTAPVHADSKNIFKWDNDIGWSYNGNITDSIREKVKRAGGKTDAKCRVSLNWFNTDDLDIHVREPNGNLIYFGNKCGKLDVDMNVSSTVRDAVENVVWDSLQNGWYEVIVDNYTRRESIDVGFVLEFEINGKIQTFEYKKPVKNNVPAFDFLIERGNLVDVKIHKNVEASSGISVETWGINTETFVKTKMLLKSPNHWDDNAIGNKHWFFILDNCKNPEPTRGIYNEFLKDELYQKHRKVFEVLGDKIKCEVTDLQLSGYGVSSTKDDELFVKVSGENFKTTIYKLYFN